ncbi:MAG: DUF2273 domain-containing protein [Lactobacillus sp.]|jgi:uncharacterized membrane protein|nr:DUF2273 domain-containing protein [Lactobacillus sp.]
MSRATQGLIIGAIIGLILVTLGFWKFLLIGLCALIGLVITQLIDVSLIKGWLNQLLNRTERS